MSGGGFRFAGRHVWEFGLEFIVKRWPFSAGVTLNKVSSPLQNGSLRYPGIIYKEKPFEGTLYWTDPDDELITEAEMMERALEISAWLHPAEREKLILDALPDRYYLGEVEVELNLEDEKWKNGESAVRFVLQPFCYALSPVTIVKELVAGEKADITLQLQGTVPAAVNLKLTAEAPVNTLRIDYGDKFISINDLNMAADDVLAIEALPEKNELMTITINGAPSMAKLDKYSQSPLMVQPGVVALGVTASGAAKAEVSVRARWK